MVALVGILDKLKGGFKALFGEVEIKTDIKLTDEEKLRKKLLSEQYVLLKQQIRLNEKKFHLLLESVKNREITPEQFEGESIKLVNDTQRINGQILAAKRELAMLGVTPAMLEQMVGGS